MATIFSSFYIVPVNFPQIPILFATLALFSSAWGKDALPLEPAQDALRDLSPDRPDATESPITVDAGHFQLEVSFYDFSRAGGTTTHTYGASNLKFGISHNVDLQFVFDAHTIQRIKLEDGSREEVSGFNDPQLRLKVNLWGNDGGKTAFAIFPFVKIPAGSALGNDHLEGGLILPLSIELTERLGLGLMAEMDFVHAEEGGYDTEFVHTAVLGIDLTSAVGLYLEYVGVCGTGGEFQYQATFSGGLTYAINNNIQLDLGIRTGLNSAAEDFGAFTGITWRH